MSGSGQCGPADGHRLGRPGGQLLPGAQDGRRRRGGEWAKGCEEDQRLIVLPEMFATGFSMEASRVAAHAQITRDFMDSLASELSVHVLGGYAEPWEPRPANACSLFNPEGDGAPPLSKAAPILPGQGARTLHGGEKPGHRRSRRRSDLSPDLLRPSLSGTLPTRGKKHRSLLCHRQLAGPTKRCMVHPSQSRAIENQAFVLGVNRVGQASGLSHSGDSALIDPMGAVTAEAVPYEEGLVLGKVDPKEVERTRRQLSFLKDRRPGLYGRLEAEAE